MRKELIDFFERVIILLDEFDVKYTISYGSLLGAVRHQNIIPWDDDIDIDIPDIYISKLLSLEFMKRLDDSKCGIFVNHYNDLPNNKPLVIVIIFVFLVYKQ
jgi:lipopolysaccharide cholinephosphotransferase